MVLQETESTGSGTGSLFSLVHWNRFVFLAFLISFVATMEMGMVTIAVPTIVKNLNADTSLAIWIILGYLLSLTGFILLAGRLIDIYGLRRVMLAGFLVYFAGLLIAACSASIDTLLLSRFIQGIGGSVLLTGIPALIKLVISHDQWPAAFGILAVATSLGALIGAPAAGFILLFGDWHVLFLLLAASVALTAVLFAFLVPARQGPAISGRVNLPLFFLIFCAVASFVVAFNQGDEHGWDSPAIILLLVLSLILFLVFAIRNRQASNPLLDITLLKSPAFATGNLCGFIAKFADSGPFILIPLFLTTVHGFDILIVGFIMAARPAASFVAGSLNAKVSKHASPLAIMTAAMAAMVVSYLGLGLCPPGTAIAVFITLMVLRGIAVGFFNPKNRASIMDAVTSGNEGSGSGFMRLVEEFSVVVGVVIFWAVFSVFLPINVNMSEALSSPKIAGTPLMAFQTVFFLAAVLSGIVILILWFGRADLRTTRTGNS